MGLLTRRIALFIIIGPLCAMLAEPFFEALFDFLGVDSENLAAPMISLISEYRFGLVFLVGLGMGVWAHWIAIKYDRRPKKVALGTLDLTLHFIDEISEKWQQLRHEIRTFHGNRLREKPIDPVYSGRRNDDSDPYEFANKFMEDKIVFSRETEIQFNERFSDRLYSLRQDIERTGVPFNDNEVSYAVDSMARNMQIDSLAGVFDEKIYYLKLWRDQMRSDHPKIGSR